MKKSTKKKLKKYYSQASRIANALNAGTSMAFGSSDFGSSSRKAKKKKREPSYLEALSAQNGW